MKRIDLVLVVTMAAVVVTGRARADTVGSVEPIIDNGVVDTGPLTAQPLEVRGAFAERLLQCGLVDGVERVLAEARVTTTLDARNLRFAVSAGGFQGQTSPTFAFAATDTGPHAASHADIQAITDSLGFVMTQDSGFLLDEDDPTSFDFPTHYAVLVFRRTPPLAASAALFETVGQIDPELFDTDTSGYTQVGRSYVSLQSDVPDDEFIAGYVQAARELGVAYTPVIDGKPALFQGGAAFPGNDWVAHPGGEDYLARLPDRVHDRLRQLRALHLDFTRRAVHLLAHTGDRRERLHRLSHLDCR